MRSSGNRMGLFALGLAVGALGGLAVERRARARRMPHLDAWQRALAKQWGEVGAAMLASRVQARYDALHARRPYFAQRALRSHLENNILPGLALYQVLLEETGEQGAALAEVEELFKAHLAPHRRFMQWLAHLPRPFFALLLGILHTGTRFSGILRTGTRFTLPSQGWQIEVIEDNRNCFALDIYRCFYLNALAWYGAPELTVLFCNADDFIYEALAPAILWKRTKTLSQGDDHCDCRWRLAGEAMN